MKYKLDKYKNDENKNKETKENSIVYWRHCHHWGPFYLLIEGWGWVDAKQNQYTIM